jgi:hypothetical protein
MRRSAQHTFHLFLIAISHQYSSSVDYKKYKIRYTWENIAIYLSLVVNNYSQRFKIANNTLAFIFNFDLGFRFLNNLDANVTRFPILFISMKYLIFTSTKEVAFRRKNALCAVISPSDLQLAQPRRHAHLAVSCRFIVAFAYRWPAVGLASSLRRLTPKANRQPSYSDTVCTRCKWRVITS